MNVIILAGGFAVRLRPISNSLAKPLLQVGDKSILDHIVDQVLELDFEHIFLLSNSKFCLDFIDWWHTMPLFYKKKITVIDNQVRRAEEKKGAIADLKLTLRNISDDVLVIAADNLFEYDIKEFVEFGQEKKASAVAVKDLDDIELIKNYGSVLLDENNKVTFFEEKPATPKSTLCATACYYLVEKDVELLREYEFEDNDNIGGIVGALSVESKIFAYVFDEYWCDIGTFEQLRAARIHFG